MKIKYVILSLFFLSQVAYAALPPTAESMRRIKAIMDSKEVYNKLGSANWILSVTQAQEGQYTLQSEKCTLAVQVEATPPSDPKLIGPLPLTVKVGELSCVTK